MNAIDDLSDETLANLEKKIASVYKRAGEEMEVKYQKLTNEFKKKDAEWNALYNDNKISIKQLVELEKQYLQGSSQAKELKEGFAKDMVNTNKIASSIINDDAAYVFSFNHNYAAYYLEQDIKMDLSFSLYDTNTVKRLLKNGEINTLPQTKIDEKKDERWNQQKIQSELLQGILQGESVDEIAERFQKVVGMNEKQAIRNARTATTGAQNAGRLDSYAHAKKMGIKIKKEWLATLDGKTRHTHQILDGQVVDIDKPFKVDGMKINFPGDPSAPPELTYNCRCTLISKIAGVDYSNEKRIDNITRDIGKKVSYQEWENSHRTMGFNLPKLSESTKTDIEKFVSSLPSDEKRAWTKFINETNYKVKKETSRTREGVYYSPTEDEVNLFDTTTSRTFFHETGHAVDSKHIEVREKMASSRKLSTGEWVEGKGYDDTANGASYAAQKLYEMNENAYNEDEEVWLSWAGMRKDVAGDSATVRQQNFSNLRKSIEKFGNKYGEDNGRILSDMIDGQTSGEYPLIYFTGGHGDAYWKSDATKVSKEAWAHFCSLKAQGRNDVIEEMGKILPNRMASNEKIYNILTKGEKYENTETKDTKSKKFEKTIKIIRSGF